MLYSNVDCLSHDKRLELKELINDKNPDIVALTEIYPKNSMFKNDDAKFNIDLYDKFITEMDSGRGIVIYVKSSLGASEINHDSEFNEQVWCEINLKNNDKLLIGCIYRSPNSTILNSNSLNKLIIDASTKRFSHILILGDYNYKEINWVNGSTSVSENHIATRFLETVRDSFLYQHVTKPTRVKDGNVPSVLDLVFTNEENMVENIEYNMGLGKSDHLMLEIDFNCYIENSVNSRKKYMYNRGNYTQMLNELKSVNWDANLVSLCATEAWNIFAEIILKSIEKNIPVNNFVSGRGSKPVDRQARNAIRLKRTKWLKYKYCSTHKNLHLYKQARNNVVYELRKCKINFEKRLAADIKINNKEFWKYVRSNAKTTITVGKIEDLDGNLITEEIKIAERLNNHFISVFTKENLSNIPVFLNRHFTNETNTTSLSKEKVKKIIIDLKQSKSQGPDGLHPKVIKECAEELAEPLTKIFETSLREGTLPVAWKSANVTAIFKAGKRSLAENYRPISITPICCRIMEKIVRDEILSHMNSNNLISVYQHGFLYYTTTRKYRRLV